ncbi:MAG: hypothetical protein JXR03_03050 [Cyclobacteriaceae bacterium]
MSKVDEILTKLNDGIKDLTVLNIQTVMGQLEIKEDGKVGLQAGTDIDGMTSKIDLIDGDITTNISPTFYQTYPELVQFHQSREAKGSDIIEANMDALKSIVGALTGIDSFLGKKES